MTDRIKDLVRQYRPVYHAVMAVVYLTTAAPILLWAADSVLLVLAISIETAVSTHLAGWAAEQAASD